MARRTRRSRKKRRFLKIIKSKIFWIIFFIFSTGLGLAYFLLLSDVFQIEEMKISGNKKVNEEEVLEAVEPRVKKELELGPFSLFSSRSIFLIGSRSLEQSVKQAFPRVGEVKVKKGLPNVLNLEIKERDSFAEICLLSGECYKTDEKGIVFEKSADVREEKEGDVQVFQVKREELMVIFVRGAAGFDLGTQAISPLYLAGASKIEQKIKSDLEMEPKELSLGGEKLIVDVNKGFKVYFNLDKNVEDQLFNLELVLREKLSDRELEELEYIDLRFGNRIYYK